jgi:predicted transposase/invertase (TIGR01784 family)
MTKRHIRFDWAAKRMLRDKKNFDILEGFLSELLKEDIKIEGLLESEGNQEEENDKFNRVDLYAENSKGEHIIIEIQNTRELDYLMRMLFGTSKAILDYMPIGAKYSSIRKVIAVSIVYFDLGQGDDYIYVGQTRFMGLHNHSELQLTPTQKKLFGKQHVHQTYPEYYLIRTPKFNDIINEPLDEWIYFFKNSEVLDSFKAKGMNEVREKLNLMKMTEAERKKYDKYVERLSDEASYADTLKIEAEERVREDERLKIVVSMIKMNFDTAIIAKATDRSEEEIESIRKNL